jgi:hypothetical protein
MWFCFNDGFVSAVQDVKNKNLLVVRARRREHLENIFPDTKILVNAGTDYKYRVYIEKQKFALIVKERILDINYDNFKNSVDDNDLRKLYGDFWYLHYRYQN